MTTTSALQPSGWCVDVPKQGWMPGELDLDALAHELRPEELEAVDRLLEKINERGLRPTDVTFEDFSDPALDGMLAERKRALQEGPGLVFLKGLPVERYDVEDLKKLYFGLGTHFGQALSQSRRGQKTGEVRALKEPGKGHRAFDRPKAIALHNDPAEILSLFCVIDALTGGESVFASSLMIMEIIQRERPDVAEILEKGFFLYRLDEHSEGRKPVTPFRVPVFGKVGQLASATMYGEMYEPSACAAGMELTPQEKEAVDYLLSVIRRRDLQIKVELESGDIVFFSNFEVLHGRKGYTPRDDEDNTRFLLRLWLQDDPPRPVPAGMHYYDNPSGLQGVDPVSDRVVDRLLDASRKEREVFDQKMRENTEKFLAARAARNAGAEG